MPEGSSYDTADDVDEDAALGNPDVVDADDDEVAVILAVVVASCDPAYPLGRGKEDCTRLLRSRRALS